MFRVHLKKLISKVSVCTFFCSSVFVVEGAEDHFKLILKTLSSVESEDVQANMLQGILDGLSGIKQMTPPEEWAAIQQSLSKSQHPKIKSTLMLLNQKFGDKQAIEKAIAAIKDPQEGLEKRRSQLSALLIQKIPELLVVLIELIDSPLQIEAIRALGVYDDSSVPGTLLKVYPRLDAQAKRAVVETLATRKSYANRLLQALKKKVIEKNEIPAYVARTLMKMFNDNRFEEVYGEIKGMSQDKTKLISQYKSKINSRDFEAADVYRGRVVFEKTCAACHKMYGEGGIIGPDLTGSNRADQDYILLNIIDPSFDVPSTYRMVTLTKKDGQVLTGNIVEENLQKVVLSMVGTKMTVPKSDIAKRDVSNISLMPEGLLSTLKDREFLDLIKYLQTEEQVEIK